MKILFAVVVAGLFGYAVSTIKSVLVLHLLASALGGWIIGYFVMNKV